MTPRKRQSFIETFETYPDIIGCLCRQHNQTSRLTIKLNCKCYVISYWKPFRAYNEAVIRNCIISHCRSDFWITFIANGTFQKLIKTDNECSTSWMLINLKDSFISIKRKYFNYFDEMRKSLSDLISIQINLLRHVMSTKERDWINLNPTRWLWLTWVYSVCRFESGSPRTTFKISSGINFQQEENPFKKLKGWKKFSFSLIQIGVVTLSCQQAFYLEILLSTEIPASRVDQKFSSLQKAESEKSLISFVARFSVSLCRLSVGGEKFYCWRRETHRRSQNIPSTISRS